MNCSFSGRALLGGLALIVGGHCMAFQAPDRLVLPNFDKRQGTNQSNQGRSPEQREAIARLCARLPDVRVELDPITGSPKNLSASAGFLTRPAEASSASAGTNGAASPATGPYGPTKAFLRENAGLFGHGPEALDKALIKRDSVTAHNGLRTVVWQQQVNGVPLFEAILISHTTRNGELVSLSSQLVPDPALAAERSVPNRSAILLAPPVPAARAVAIAARNVGELVLDGQITPLETSSPAPNSVRAGTRLFKGAGIKGEAETSLVWLPLSADRLSLCWEIVFTSRTRDEMFRVLVDAQTGEPLLRHCLTAYLSDATYNVFTKDSPSPLSPGLMGPLTNQPALVARAPVTLSALDTNASPAGWIDDGGNETRGNNVDAHTDRDADNSPDLPRPHGTPSRVFDFPLDLEASDPTNYASASVVQLFYLCNWMHDKLYALGFDEAAGNFESNNFGRGGLGNDAVLADAQDAGGYNNANFSTPPDGSPGRMQMYLFSGPSPRRDGDLDAEVVLHEYAHGLSNRRVGGGLGISSLQSAGMGEGWSDFYALSLLSENSDDPNGDYAMGGYVGYLMGGSQQNYYFGIRRYPYTTDLNRNPLTFKDIDPGQAAYCSSGAPYNSAQFGLCSTLNAAEVHNQGEVWCSILWQIRANLIAKFGWAAGNQLSLKLVTDGLVLSPPNPNFVQARDAILTADLVDTGGANREQLWAAFAKRGLGLSASSPVSSTTSGVYEAFDVPDDLRVTPSIGFTISGPVGGPFSTNSVSFTVKNAGTNALSWAAASASPWLTVPPGGGVLPAGGSFGPISITVSSNANLLPASNYFGTIWFVNINSGLVQSRQILLRVGQPEPYTEIFENSDNDLAHQSITFTPDGSPSYYAVCRDSATAFPVDPAGGVQVSLTDDSFVAVELPGTNTVSLYGRRTNVFFIGSNGYITLGAGDNNYLETPSTHFNRPRISALFHDLNPDMGGTISWKMLPDRIAVSYQNVPQYGSLGFNNFQIELFGDGRLRLTYLSLACPNMLVGLSAGQGIPLGFAENDLDAFPSCPARPPILLTQPVNQAAQPGSTFAFSVVAEGSSPFGYQWMKGGSNLTDGPRISGAASSSLVISPVLEADSGQYSVRVTNVAGAVLSSNATLLVSTVDHFLWNHIPSPQAVSVPFRVVLEAQDSYNTRLTNFGGLVGFRTASAGSPVSPSAAGAFVQGIWIGTLSVLIPATNLVLVADDGFGHKGFSEPIQFTSAPRLERETFGNILLLIWPAGAPDLKLETSTRISPPAWVPAPAPLQFGDQLLVPVVMSDPVRFFRLHYSPVSGPVRAPAKGLSGTSVSERFAVYGRDPGPGSKFSLESAIHTP